MGVILNQSYSGMVNSVFRALTEREAAFKHEIYLSCHRVVSDFTYLLDD